jgi:hypothetical protein
MYLMASPTIVVPRPHVDFCYRSTFPTIESFLVFLFKYRLELEPVVMFRLWIFELTIVLSNIIPPVFINPLDEQRWLRESHERFVTSEVFYGREVYRDEFVIWPTSVYDTA